MYLPHPHEWITLHSATEHTWNLQFTERKFIHIQPIHQFNSMQKLCDKELEDAIAKCRPAAGATDLAKKRGFQKQKQRSRSRTKPPMLMASAEQGQKMSNKEIIDYLETAPFSPPPSLAFPHPSPIDKATCN